MGDARRSVGGNMGDARRCCEGNWAYGKRSPDGSLGYCPIAYSVGQCAIPNGVLRVTGDSQRCASVLPGDSQRSSLTLFGQGQRTPRTSVIIIRRY